MVEAQYLKPVEFLKNRGPELSHIYAKLFKMCLKQLYFLDCWKVSSVVSIFTNVGKQPTVPGDFPLPFSLYF